MQITILGKRWRILFVPAKELRDTTGKRDCDGKCDPPDLPGKAIRIYDKLTDERLLTVLCHEILHAADWSKDESWVEDVAESFARAAMKVGFTRKEHDAE